MASCSPSIAMRFSAWNSFSLVSVCHRKDFWICQLCWQTHARCERAHPASRKGPLKPRDHHLNLHLNHLTLSSCAILLLGNDQGRFDKRRLPAITACSTCQASQYFCSFISSSSSEGYRSTWAEGIVGISPFSSSWRDSPPTHSK